MQYSDIHNVTKGRIMKALHLICDLLCIIGGGICLSLGQGYYEKL